jgi:beta-lactam-binding protein with PASTA domain
MPKANPFRKRVWTLGRLLVLVAALGATYGLFFLAALRVATKAREVSVPELVGRSVDNASQTLSELGLGVRVDPLRRPDATVPADHVVAQDPEPGTVLRRQRSVRIRVSAGDRAPTMPDLAGQSERTVEAGLAEDGITVALRAEIRTADYPTGSIVAQDPPPDERAGAVNLLVNRGERSSSYVMPDLIGTPGRQAIDVLRARGFRATIVAELSYPGLPSGIVIRQTPQAGFQIAFGETISLEVSR